MKTVVVVSEYPKIPNVYRGVCFFENSFLIIYDPGPANKFSRVKKF